MINRLRNKSEDLSEREFIKKLRLFNLALNCLSVSTKCVSKFLTAIERNVAETQKTQREFKGQTISSRKNLQEELGYLLLSLEKDCNDDERRRNLRLIESTLKHYVNLSEKI